MFTRAVEWGALETTPLPSVKDMDVDDEGRVRWLSIEEESRFWKALDEREEEIRSGRRRANEWRSRRRDPALPDLDQVAFVDHLKPMCIIAMNTGVRRGELFGLEVEKVDLAKRIMTVAGLSGKTKDTRHIPLNDDAHAALKSWIEQNRITTGLVFRSRKGKKFTNIQTSWENLLERAQIEDFHFHDMRHHFASWLVMEGEDLNTVRELLGHKTIRMTLKYAHLAPEHKAASVAKLSTRRRRFNDEDEKRRQGNEGWPSKPWTGSTR